jgi:hypothetical protein
MYFSTKFDRFHIELRTRRIDNIQMQLAGHATVKAIETIRSTLSFRTVLKEPEKCIIPANNFR